MPSHWTAKKRIAFALWVLFAMSLGAAASQVAAPEALAELAREKDIVYLALITGLSCLSFSAWLVKQLLSQANDNVKALRELRDELKSRPCYFPTGFPRIKTPTENP